MAAAEEALALIRVDYKPLPFVVDMDEAPWSRVAEGLRRRVGAGSFGRGDRRASRAAARTAMCAAPRRRVAATSRRASRGADVIVEGEYRTQVQTHCCMEPHGLVADWRPDGLTVHMSTQFTAGVRRELARRSTCRSRMCGSSSTAWAAASARSRRWAPTGASLSRSRARPRRRCGSRSTAPRGADGLGQPARDPSAHPHRRAARRNADRDLGREPRHRWRGAGRRGRQFRSGALRLPELRIRAI